MFHPAAVELALPGRVEQLWRLGKYWSVGWSVGGQVDKIYIYIYKTSNVQRAGRVYRVSYKRVDRLVQPVENSMSTTD